MPNHDSRDLNPVDKFVHQFDEHLSAQIKSLLEGKHVYQKVMIEPEKISAEIRKQVKGNQKFTEEQIAFALNNPLTLSSGGPSRLIPRGEQTLPPF
jgi:hypothetical protein